MPEKLEQLEKRIGVLEQIDQMGLKNRIDFLERINRQAGQQKTDDEKIRKIRRITLTSAQILALNTPITIIPAFLTSVIIVEGITARLNFNTTAYTGANALEFRYTGATGAKVTADMASTFINSAATAYDHVAGVTTELTPVINAPIVAVVPTANPATGNSTMDLFIRYRVITF